MGDRIISAGDIFIADTGRSLNVNRGGAVPVIVVDVIEDEEFPPLYVSLRISGARYCRDRVSAYIGTRYGTKRRSAVVPDDPVIVTDTAAFIKRIGHVDSGADMECVRKLYRDNNDMADIGYILSLCPVCLRNFMDDRDRIVRRVDRSDRARKRCDFCQMRNGYVYMLMKKRRRRRGGAKRI